VIDEVFPSRGQVDAGRHGAGRAAPPESGPAMSKRQRVEWAFRVAPACDVIPLNYSFESTTICAVVGVVRGKFNNSFGDVNDQLVCGGSHEG
jgi:hypothetical protein